MSIKIMQYFHCNNWLWMFHILNGYCNICSYSSVRRESVGTSTVVRGKGEGGGADRETGTARNEEGNRASTRHANPGDACRQDKGIQTIAGGAVSFASPPTPKPSTTSRTGWGEGGANLHMRRWKGNQERTLVGRCSRRVVAFRRMDDEWPAATGWGRLNTLTWTERRQKGRKERGYGQDALEGKEPGWILERGKREKGGTRTITDGKHSNLNIGKEYRVQIADALGKELHHPKTSKLWDSKNGPTYRYVFIYKSWQWGISIRPLILWANNLNHRYNINIYTFN